MQKRFVPVFLLLVLTLFLAGCAAETTEPTAIPPETEAVTEPVTVPANTSAGEETRPAAPVDKSKNELPYVQSISAGQSIYTGPHYDSGIAMVLGENGIFTIVEEAVDDEGNLWGKLKSGIGWVDLTEIQQKLREGILLSANYADDQLLSRGNYHHYVCGREFSVPIAFRAGGKLRDVVLFYYEMCDEGYRAGEDFYTLAELTEQMPLVAELDFPGDMTSYGIRFVDENGKTHVFRICQSLRNGALELLEE